MFSGEHLQSTEKHKARKLKPTQCCKVIILQLKIKITQPHHPELMTVNILVLLFFIAF